MVERYLIKKSLMKPLQGIAELKRFKSLDGGDKEGLTPAQIKELKSYFVGFEQLFVPQNGGSTAPKGSSTASQSMGQPNKGGSFTNDTPKEIIKEVCCCGKSQNGNSGGNSLACVRKKGAGGKNEATGQTEELLTKQSDLKALAERKFWKHILLKVKHRKRLENGAMGNVCQAMNIVTGEKCALLVDP